MTTFSLVCACKNEEIDIAKLISTIALLNYPRNLFEVIFSDDSSDNTKNIIEQNLCLTDIDWSILDGQREGCCAARNAAITRAKYNFIVFLTADTLLERSYLDNLHLRCLNYDIIMPDSSCLYSNNPTIFERFAQTDHELRIYRSIRSGKMPLTSQGYCVNTQKAINAGLISTPSNRSKNYCNDYTLVQKMLSNGASYKFDPDLLVYHIQPDTLQQFFSEKLFRGLMSRRKLRDVYQINSTVIVTRALIKLILKTILLPICYFKVLQVYLRFPEKISPVAYFLLYPIEIVSFFGGEISSDN